MFRSANNLAAFILPLAVAAPIGAAPRVIPISIRSGGDDGYTNKLVDELKTAIMKSKLYELSDENSSGIEIIIPTNVEWLTRGVNDRVLYEVNAVNHDRLDSIRLRGSCWADHIRVCAKDIISRINTAVRR